MSYTREWLEAAIPGGRWQSNGEYKCAVRDERTPSCFINLEKRNYRDFGGKSGRLSDLLREMNIPDPYQSEKGAATAAPRSPEAESAIIQRQKARQIWEDATEPDGHPYLSRKGVDAHGARRMQTVTVWSSKDERLKTWSADVLVVPSYAPDGSLIGIEQITADGTKYACGSKGFFALGEIDPEHPVIVCEGYATAASVKAITGWNTVCAFGHANLEKTANAVQKLTREIVAIAPDSMSADLSGDFDVVEIPGDRPKNCDWNDLCAEHGIEIVKQMFRDQWAKRHKVKEPEKPKTINLLDFRRKLEPEKGKKPEMIGGLFPRGGVSIVAGQQGTGKSVLMQRICSDVSIGGEVLDGVTTYAPKRKTLFLVGELPVDSMNDRQRTTGWKHDDEALVLYSRLDFAKAEIALDMTDAVGWKNITEIVHGEEPDLIVFDSFMSFNTADESDMQQMQSAFTKLLKLADETKSAVILVHHIRKRKTLERSARLHMDDIIGSSIITRNASVAIGAELLEVDGEQWIFVNTLKTWYAPMEEFAFKMIRDEFKVLRGIEVNLDPKTPAASRIEAIENAVFVDHKDGSSFTAKEIEEATEASGIFVRKTLKRWTDEGKLRKEGGSKNTAYSIMRKYQNHISALANTEKDSDTPVSESIRISTDEENSSETFRYSSIRIFPGDTNGSDHILIQEHDTREPSPDSDTPSPCGNLEKFNLPMNRAKEAARQDPRNRTDEEKIMANIQQKAPDGIVTAAHISQTVCKDRLLVESILARLCKAGELEYLSGGVTGDNPTYRRVPKEEVSA